MKVEIDLDNATNEELFYILPSLEANKQKELKQLIFEKNIGLTRHFLKKINFYDLNRYLIDTDDIISEAQIGLWKAIDKYNNQVSRFATFASVVISNEVGMYIRKHKKHKYFKTDNSYYDEDGKEFTIFDFMEDQSANTDEIIDGKFNNELLREILHNLNEKEKELIISYYFKEMKQAEISKALNISQSMISRKIKRLNAKIKKIYGGEYYGV